MGFKSQILLTIFMLQKFLSVEIYTAKGENPEMFDIDL